jgi:hypothetical protein
MAGNITRNWPREIMPPLSPIDRILIAAAGLLAPQLFAGQLAATTIEFAPRVTTQLQRYGSEEAGALRSAILAALSRETGRVATPGGLVLTVLVQDVVPTHPTRKQASDDPAADVVRTKYLGGAELVGYVRDANRRLVATVSYRHFAPTLRLGSASLDPWADARLAIDEFAARLAVACRDLPRAAKQSRHAPQGGVGPSLTRTRS